MAIAGRNGATANVGYGRPPRPISSTPSGIAQLRKSSEQRSQASSEAMNLDEFLHPGLIASPAGVSLSPPRTKVEPSQNAFVTPIPIKERKDATHPTFNPASVPTTHQDRQRNYDFGYVQKHIRKTSIDERRVIYCVWSSHHGCLLIRGIDAQAAG